MNGFQLDTSDVQGLLRRLASVNDRVANQGARKALRSAGKILEPVLRRNTPKQPAKPANVKDMRHMRDTVSVKQKTYRARNAAPVTVLIIGYASPQVRHAHLVERGTNPRWTKHSTRYQELGRRAIRGRNGVRFKRVRKSTGSYHDPDKAGVPRFTGSMPAFHPVERSLRETTSSMKSAIEAELRKAVAKAGV